MSAGVQYERELAAIAERHGVAEADRRWLIGLLEEMAAGPAEPPASGAPDQLGETHPPRHLRGVTELEATRERVEVSSAPTRAADTEVDPSGALDAEAAAGAVVSPRYVDLGILGAGGMGEVRRVLDRDLSRPLAMKVMADHSQASPGAVARFLEEAQVTAQLQHPGIVPVHETGRLPDGRLYYTMKIVSGQPLSHVIAEVHAASCGDSWEPSASGWTFWRLVEAFEKVCQALAFAHAHGVIHRDLKPSNVMVGDFGETLVIDWGLAKVLGRTGLPGGTSAAGGAIVSVRSASGQHATRYGAVAGTVQYMPPEQARGAVDELDARSDVYSLGAILYEILSGRPPYEGRTTAAILAAVVAGALAPPGRLADAFIDTYSEELDEGEAEPRPAVGGPPLPRELVAACLRALSLERADRFADAGELAAEVARCLERAQRRERATALVEAAAAKGPEADGLRQRALRLRAQAAEHLATVKLWEPSTRKAPGWALEDEAAALERRARRIQQAAERLLHAALTHDRDLPEAHAALAEIYRARHAAAEVARDPRAAAQAAPWIEAHATALPSSHPARRACAAYLRGTGAVTVVTDPPGAEVLAYRYRTHCRRLVPELEGVLGTTPLQAHSLPMGSWLLVLRGEGRADVRYPVWIRRGEHWDGIPPEGGAPSPIALPAAGALKDDEIYVPQGWFWCGGDPQALGSLSWQRVWLDAFVMLRFPVTVGQFLDFLNALVGAGGEDQALASAPRLRAGAVGEEGPLLYPRDASGCFRPSEADELDSPAGHVDWHGSAAYAAWLAARTGLAWRLPWELEQEKAARGVDGRLHPWGDAFDDSWCNMAFSHDGGYRRCPVDSFPVDTSVYGLRGMAGNSTDRCGDVYRLRGPTIVAGRPQHEPAQARLSQAIRGGSWCSPTYKARCAWRNEIRSKQRYPDAGFRLARSLGGA